MRPDSGYGLLFADAFFEAPWFFFEVPFWLSEDEGLRFASRLIQPAKGRFRVVGCRSLEPRISRARTVYARGVVNKQIRNKP